jgi:NADPH-dependent 2,4-dienoyl-CoA reductase/sulfur reductase-like enzyme
VVVGASLGGLRAAEALRRAGYDGPVTIVGAERHRPYDRPPLSKQVLTGKAGPDDIGLPEDPALEAEWRLGTAATGLDLDRRRVVLEGGEDLPFERLVIATGSQPRRLASLPEGPGVHYLRTIDDSLRLRDELGTAERVAVVGAGFIGLEVASSAAALGLGVSVVELLPVPLEAAIGAEMGAAVAEMHRRRDIDLHLSVRVEELTGRAGVAGLRLDNGREIPADVVVVGIGVAPATGWLEGSGVDLHDGVRCDSRLRVLVGGRPRPDVVAVGDVARWTHETLGTDVRVEHWTNAAEQGEAAAHTLVEGDAAPPYEAVPYFWSDQHGTKIQFVGTTRPGDDFMILEGDPAEERFVAAYGRDGRLVAALGMRRPARIMALQRMIGAGTAFPPPPPDA